MESSSEINLSKYKMYLKTIQASAIRTLQETLKEILTDVNIYFDDKGFSINSMDRFEKAFVSLKLDADKFETFYCPRPFFCGVNMISLYKLLKMINNSDIISLYIEKENDQKLCIKIENDENKSVSVAQLKLIDVDEHKIIIPHIPFKSIYNMQCSDFQKKCRDLHALSDTVRIYNNGDVFKLQIKNDTFADLDLYIGKNTKNPPEEFRYIGAYDLKILNLFCKSSGLCPTIEIYLQEEFPLILSFSVAGLGSVKFGLCPFDESSED